jgi:hypothetical protein
VRPAYRDGVRGVRASNIGAKVLLGSLLAHAALFPDLPRYVDKGMPYRLALYPVAAALVPLVWFAVVRSRSSSRYPHLVDLCVVLPFLLDTAGNTADLFDRISWWDDVMHVVNWIPWVTAVGLLLRERVSNRLLVAAVTIGFGAVTHVLWEIAEFATFVQDNPREALSAYRDTIGDLAASLAGSFLGGVLVTTWLWSVGRGSPPDGTPAAPPLRARASSTR